MYAGIDIGSTTSKAVLIDSSRKQAGAALMDTLPDRAESGTEIFRRLLQSARLDRTDVKAVVATGYGRKSCSEADWDIPEILCHSIGVHERYPEARAIIDIGGQDSKVIELDSRGRAVRFEMNDKCAAGTGRFFEVLSGRLFKVSLDDLSGLILAAKEPCKLSSMCTIFAETEIVSYLSAGKSRESIAAGMAQSVARRVIGMAKGAQVSLKGPVVFSGGAANNEGLRKTFADLMNCKVTASEQPQLTGAFGAALAAKKKYERMHFE